MSDEWVGATLGDLVSLEYGRALPEKARDGIGFPVLGSNGVVGRHSRALVDGPGIVVGRKGTAGSVTWVESDFCPIDTTYWVRPKSEDADLRFLYLLLELCDLPRVCAQTGVPGLNRDRAYELAVLVPPTAVQRRIVDLLAHLAKHLANLRTEREAVDALLVAIVTSVVADAASWVPLGEVVEVRQGKSLPVTVQGQRLGITPWFKVADLGAPENTYGYRVGNTTLDEQAISALGGQVLPVGSVVFPRVGAAVLTERKRIIEVPAAVDENHLVLVPTGKAEPHFVHGFMANLRLSGLVQSGAVPSLNMGLVRSIPFPDIPLEQQQQTGQVLRALKSAAAALVAEERRLSAVRAALLAALLSGSAAISESYDESLSAVA